MKREVATFGGGCFWCIEAVIQELKGVEKLVSGYAGGTVPGTPTYREVCSGLTGHAEVVQVSFDSELLSYHDLITIFMTSHDPTQLNRQGADRGTQYRSVIYYHSTEQQQIANQLIEELKTVYNDPIVTELSRLPEFHVAEVGHQEYYNNNPDASYCRAVIDPKISKLRQLYADRLKK
ncbi:MAG: peptide-methionine (S)-S-oxide reductase MsrA [Flavobacteriales bacterium]|nr:peptide-methionine (S)-S-oxide reductase MsrA [Flavobacteriales bacterium]